MDVQQILNAAIQKRIPTTYTVGGKQSSGIPMDIRLSLDPDFKKTVLIGTSMLSLGIAVGLALSKK